MNDESPTLKIERSESQFSIQFPKGEIIPLFELLRDVGILYLFLIALVVSLFAFNDNMMALGDCGRVPLGAWCKLTVVFIGNQECPRALLFLLIPFISLVYIPGVFVWNYSTVYELILDPRGISISHKQSQQKRRQRFTLEEIQQVVITKSSSRSWFTRLWGIRLFFLPRGLLKLENTLNVSCYFGQNINARQAEEVMQQLNEQIARFKMTKQGIGPTS